MKKSSKVKKACFHCGGIGYWWESEKEEEYQGAYCCIRCDNCGFRTNAAHGYGNGGDLSLGLDAWNLGRGMKEKVSTIIR